jgi:hypothetical protein
MSDQSPDRSALDGAVWEAVCELPRARLFASVLPRVAPARIPDRVFWRLAEQALASPKFSLSNWRLPGMRTLQSSDLSFIGGSSRQDSGGRLQTH